MMTTLEQRVNERFAQQPIDMEIDRPVVLSSASGPVTCTPAIVTVVAVRLVAVEVLTMIARRYNPF
jgi:hypothetical protein